ncbi:MAG: DUF3833 domain-containing protein [Alphaproteobacteria bacterium]|nr:DUF3833 domain-containing protein [Alphaproteobacteria bacterium]
MVAKISALIFALIVLSGCTSMKPSDFSKAEPLLRIEDYFVGQTRAWGIFEDRFGNLRRQFVVDIQGSWDGEALVLDERFRYSDGETDRRVWTIKKIDEHRYEGRAADVIGTAIGESYGNALNWRYDMDLKIGEGTLRVHFNDWMFLQSSGVLVNRARVSKFGIAIGEVTLFFQKVARQSGISAGPFNVPKNDDVKLRVASR